MTDDILIFAEQRDNRLHPAALQIVTAARQLADKTGGQVIACVIGDDIGNAAAAVNVAGVDKIVTVTDPSLGSYSTLRYRSALCGVIDSIKPRIVLMLATSMGRDLSPRVAARIGGGLATDVVDLDIVDGTLKVKRPIYNGKAMAAVEFPAGKPALATVRPNTFAAPADTGSAATETLPFSATAGDERITVKEVAKTGGDIKDVAEADIIVAGGRALKNEENFNIIIELAGELDAAVGASRAACDAGYQPHSRQIGLTGKTVTPKLYIGCGISGAIQHLAGDARQQGDRVHQHRSGSPAHEGRRLHNPARPVQGGARTH